MKAGSARNSDEQGSLWAERNEARSLNVQLIEVLRQPGTLEHSRKHGDDASAATGNGRAILSVPNVASTDFAGCAMSDWQASGSDKGAELSVKELVTQANFTAASRIVADVEAASGALVAEDGGARQAGERVAGKLRGECIRCDKEAGIAYGLVELRGGEIPGAEQQIVAPLPAAMGDVHESDA